MSSLTVTATVGSNPGLEELNVWNSGVGILYYEVASDSPLATATPHTEVSTSAGDRKRHYLEFQTSALPEGTHTLNLEVRDNGSGAVNSPVVIPVTLQIVPPPSPEIGLSTASLTVQTSEGRDAGPARFQVFNAGTGTLQYQLAAPAGWLSVNPPVGSSENEADARFHSLTLTTATLPAGTYVSWIAITAPAAVQPLVHLPVVLQVRGGGGFAAYDDLSWGPGQLASNITTRMLNGLNSTTGQVARYAEIAPGSDRMFTLRIPAATTASETRYYANSLMLRGGTPSTPQVRLQRAFDGWLALTWEGSGVILEDAPSLDGPWTTRSDQAAVQILIPDRSDHFFRLRVQ
jgi:hypothetical protein